MLVPPTQLQTFGGGGPPQAVVVVVHHGAPRLRLLALWALPGAPQRGGSWLGLYPRMWALPRLRPLGPGDAAALLPPPPLFGSGQCGVATTRSWEGVVLEPRLPSRRPSTARVVS